MTPAPAASTLDCSTTAATVSDRSTDEPLLDAPLGAGQEEEGVDQTFGFLAVRAELFEDRPQFFRAGRSIRQCFVDEHPLGRQRGPQFVRGVGHEAALAVKGPVQTAQHGVEGVGQLFELVIWGPAG